MRKAIPIALVGAGGFGRLHLHAITLLEREQKTVLRAVADPTLDRLPELKSRLREEKIPLYADYREMLESEPDLQAVAIAAPIPLHYEMAVESLRRGLYVYLEKPPVPLIGQLDELIRLDADRRVHVGFQMTSAPWAVQIKKWILAGELGEIQHVRACANWPRPDSYYQRADWAGKMILKDRPVFDGPATNALSHLIHAALFLTGDASSPAQPDLIQGELYRSRKIESYDIACLRGTLTTGAEFAFALSHAGEIHQPYQLQVVGTLGNALVTDDGSRLQSVHGIQTHVESPEIQIERSYRLFLDHIQGHSQSRLSTLSGTHGYVLATNALLLSSQGIHTLPADQVQASGIAKDVFHKVTGLEKFMADTFRTGRLFAEQRVPWATPSAPVRAAAINAVDVRKKLAN